MKALFVVPPIVGHVNPTVAIGRALALRGHEVVWAGHAGVVRPLLAPDARLCSLGDDMPPEIAAAVAERSRRVRGLESVQFLWQDVLVPLARAMRPQIERLLDELRPDVVIADQQALGRALAARRAGVPWVTLATTSAGIVDALAAFPKVRAWVDAQLAALEDEAGLPRLPTQADLSPSRVILTSSRALVGDAALPPQVRLIGPTFAGRPDATPFPWDALRPGRRILVSLGTVSAERGQPFYRAVAEAFAGADLQVLLVAPPELAGEVPANVLVRPRVPQIALLPHVDAVVTHGGHNTVCEALAHGLPLVVAPIRDDQPVVAGQVVASGAGVRVRFGGLSGATLHAAVTKVLDEPGYRAAAARVRASFVEAGGEAEAARLIEDLGRS